MADETTTGVISIGGKVKLPQQSPKKDTPRATRLDDAPSDYIVVNDPFMVDVKNNIERSCVILFDWVTFVNKIIGVDDRTKLKEEFIAAIRDVLERLNIPFSTSKYEEDLNREINKSLTDFRASLSNVLGGSSCNFSLENFKEQWVVQKEGNAFYGQSIIQEGIRFVIDARGRFPSPSTGLNDFYRIFTGFVSDINETANPLDRRIDYVATDMSTLLSSARYNIVPAINEKDPLAQQKDPTIFTNVIQGKSLKQILESIFEAEATDRIEIRRPFYWKIENGGADIGFNSNNFGIVDPEYRRNWHIKRHPSSVTSYRFDRDFQPMVLIWGHTGLAYAEVFGRLKLFISGFKTKADILTDLANITFFKTYIDSSGNVHFHPPRFEEEEYLSLNNGYKGSDTDKEHALTHTTFDDDTVTQSYSQSSKDICTVARGHSEGDWGIYEKVRQTADPNFLKATIVWEDGVNRFGFKEGNITTSAVGPNDSLLNLFTAAFLLRRNQERFGMTATVLMRPELQIDRPVYDYNKNKIYYIRNITHTYSAGTPNSGGSYTTSIICNAGRPVGEKISSNIFASALSGDSDFDTFINNYASGYNLKDYRTFKGVTRNKS